MQVATMYTSVLGPSVKKKNTQFVAATNIQHVVGVMFCQLMVIIKVIK